MEFILFRKNLLLKITDNSLVLFKKTAFKFNKRRLFCICNDKNSTNKFYFFRTNEKQLLDY